MAFNKLSIVLLVLLVSAAIGEAQITSTCECTEESGQTKCSQTDRLVGGCPWRCGCPCACTRSIPPQCWCTYEVDACETLGIN